MAASPIHHLTGAGDLAAATVVCGARDAALATWDATKVTCPQCQRACTCGPAVPLCPACRTWNAAHRGRPTARPALQTEKAFQGWLREAALAAGWMYYHPYTSIKSTEGYPDTTLIRGDRVVFAELKMPGKQPTAAQRQWLDALAQVREVQAHLWRPSDWDAITELLR